MAGTQAWIWRSWFGIPIWLWISINVFALLAGLITAWGTTYVLLEAVSFFDVFTDRLYIDIILLITTVGFGATISLIQWLVLRQRVIAPALWAIANVIMGFFTWVLLQILVSNFTLYNNWKSILLSIVAGAAVGVGSSTLINTWGRP